MCNDNIVKYPKLYEDEDIQVGDLIELNDEKDKVYLSRYRCKWNTNNIIGICTKVEDNIITIMNSGICDVNVTGIICIGDKLTLSKKPGKLKALQYEQNTTIFTIPSIGKVIGLYKQYNKAKVLLNIR